MLKQCVICSKYFPASRKTKTCSPECRKILKKINNLKNVRNWRINNPTKVDLHRFKSSIYQFQKYHEFNDNDDQEVEYIPAGWHTCEECNNYFSYSQYQNMTPDRIPYCPGCGLLLLPDNYLKDRYQKTVTIGTVKLEAIRNDAGNIDFDAERKKLRKWVKNLKVLH